jgi:DNA polymerase I-like protein with 3'-5' exonuclease and polymerase domains/uracil-DNA glycosylase
MLIGEAPGEQEVEAGRPFVGAAGRELTRLLTEAGIDREACYITNVLKIRPEGNKLGSLIALTKGEKLARTAPDPSWQSCESLAGPHARAWFHPSVAAWTNELDAEIRAVRPALIIPLGNLALWAVTGHWGIADWHGSQIESRLGYSVPTYHPADVLRQWSWRPYVTRDLARAVGALRKPEFDFAINPTLEEVHARLSDLYQSLGKRSLVLACDIETRRSQIDCIGISWSASAALCIPFWSRARANYWGEVEELSIVRALRRVLTHPNARVVGQNFSYDVQHIWRQWGFKPRLALDTMVTHHVLWPGTDKDLNTLSSLYCDYHHFWKQESKEADEREDDLGRWSYNCRDCVATWEIAQRLMPLVEDEGLRAQCEFQHAMWWRALDAMILGVRTDAATKKELAGELREEIREREGWVEKVLGHPLNLRSPKQLKALFYDDFKLPQIKVRSKKGTRISTNEEALQQIAARTPLVRPLVRRILEVRSLGVFKSTFVESKLDLDGRIRCSYNVAGTDTFRFSSSQNAFGSGMNLQNVPEGDESEGVALVLPNIRRLFLPDPGFEIFDMDLSSADLRVVVWEADEPELKAMLAAGLNPYVEIAKEFYRDDSITKSHPRYRTFKSFAHGTNYLGTPAGLAKRLGLAPSKAKRSQEWYFRRFPKIRAWQERLVETLTATRTVKNAFGYRRYFFDRLEGNIHNRAAAWIPQSTIALLINRIWDELVRVEPEVRVLLQVHDSLVGEYPADRAEYFRRRIGEVAASIAVPYAEPLTIPVGLKVSRESWGDCA